jgi:hypothetical protein
MVYLERAASLWQVPPVGPSLLKHVSPLGWEHVNLTDDYTWQSNKRVAKGGSDPSEYGYWGATEQKTRLRLQVTSTIEPDGPRRGRNWRMATIRDGLGHMTVTQRLGSIQYSSGTIFALFAGRS